MTDRTHVQVRESLEELGPVDWIVPEFPGSRFRVAGTLQPPRLRMAAQPRSGSPRRTLRTERFEAFSDGVFAIAITLLVLELTVPVVAGEDLLGALGEQWPSYLAYVVSFASVGAMWVSHTAITDYLDRVDSVLMRLNLVFLLLVCFLPFPTKLLAEYVHEPQGERVAVTVYGLTLLLVSLLVSLLWRYGVHANLTRSDADDEDIRILTRRLAPGLVSYVVMIGIGLLAPVVAVFGYLAIAVFLLLPRGLFRPGRR